MFARITFVIVLTFMAASQASSNEFIKHKAIQKKQAGNEIASDATSGYIPMPKLPPSSQKVWQEWFLPSTLVRNFERRKSGELKNHQFSTVRVRITNVGGSAVKARYECRDGQGRVVEGKTQHGPQITAAKMNISIKPYNQYSFNYVGGWCRVSADHPVIVDASRYEATITSTVLKESASRYEMGHVESIMAIPYPVE